MSKKIHSVSSTDSFLSLRNYDFKKVYSVAYAFARRDLQLRYVQTRLGWFWSIGQPLLAAGLVLIVFSWIVKIQAPDGIDYSIYAFASLPSWLLMQQIILQGSPSLVHNQHIISKVAFPRQALPLSKVLVGLLDFGVASIMYYVFRGVKLGIWDFMVFDFLFYSSCTIFAALGITYWIAAISTRFRDWLAILPLLIQGLFLLSPIAYPSSRFNSSLGENIWVLYLNPMVAISDGFRSLWLKTELWNENIYISFIMVFLLFVSGFIAIRYAENKMVDTL